MTTTLLGLAKIYKYPTSYIKSAVRI